MFKLDGKIVEKLLDKLKSEYEPEIVLIKPESYSNPDECFLNVPIKVDKDGGKVHNGWKIYENEFFYEAERHAVWENDHEELVDITPNGDEKEILFVSDDLGFVFNGQYIPNVRANSTSNPVVEDYLFVYEKIDYLTSFRIRVNKDEVKMPSELQEAIMQLNMYAFQYYSFLKEGNGLKSLCFCESKKIYKNCHKIQTYLELQEVIDRVKPIIDSLRA